jgi:hypothetical protein
MRRSSRLTDLRQRCYERMVHQHSLGVSAEKLTRGKLVAQQLDAGNGIGAHRVRYNPCPLA